MLENLDKEYCFSTRICAFYSRLDEQRVTAFCGKQGDEGFFVLGLLQQSIRDRECRRRIQRRQQKIVEEFRCLRPLPKDIGCWIRRAALPAYFFYDYRKGAKRVQGICSACLVDHADRLIAVYDGDRNMRSGRARKASGVDLSRYRIRQQTH